MKPRVIYHRGRHGITINGSVLQENTLAAFQRAIVEGAEMIEFDVWTGLKVAHDPGANTGLPTLPEVLNLISGRCSVNIEVKSPASADDTIRLIRSELNSGRWKEDQIVLSSFHHQTAINLKKELPSLRVGAINDGVLLPSYIDELANSGINNLHLDWSNIYMDSENEFVMRSKAQQNGMQIWVWTVNKVDVFTFVSNYGVDAVFTDKPELFEKRAKTPL